MLAGRVLEEDEAFILALAALTARCSRRSRWPSRALPRFGFEAVDASPERGVHPGPDLLDALLRLPQHLPCCAFPNASMTIPAFQRLYASCCGSGVMKRPMPVKAFGGFILGCL